MEFQEITLPAPGVKSLLWEGNALIDYVAGRARYGLDGAVQRATVSFAYRFDSAVASPSGRFVALYEKLGTKALLLERGKVCRELNRSYYFADVYEYPIAFTADPDGTELLIHCPREYCRLDVEVAATGECLTDRPDGKRADFFHSRLAVSPGGQWLTSAGWIWHPLDAASVWPLAAALRQPQLLDQLSSPPWKNEVRSVAFVDDHRLAAATGGENFDDSPAQERLSVCDTTSGTELHTSVLPQAGGTLIPFGTDSVLSLFEYPRLLRISDGAILHEWPHLRTGKQTSSIVHHLPPMPPFAKHPKQPRFAVADEEKITVVRLLSAS